MTKKLFGLLLLFSTFCFVLLGCSKIDKYQVDMGIKNNDFEYIKQGKVDQVIIQNTRDKGFRFVVTDERAISDLYDILSTAKPVSQKSSLQPDYVFEIYTGDNTVYKFNYIAGLDKKDLGNLYSDNKTYIVSKRIDSDIISTFWNIRRPKDFQTVYYDSLITVLDNYRKTVDRNTKIGIDIKDDVDVSKFILSVDLEEFTSNLNTKGYDAELFEGDSSGYNIVMNVNTDGYKMVQDTDTGVYKCHVTFINKKDNSQKNYYIFDNYKDNNWDIQVYADKKPDGY